MSNIVKIPGQPRYIDLKSIVSITEPEITKLDKSFYVTYSITCILLENPIIISCGEVTMVPQRVYDEEGSKKKKEEARQNKWAPCFYGDQVFKDNPLFNDDLAKKFNTECFGCHPMVEDDGRCLVLDRAYEDWNKLLNMWKGVQHEG